MNIHPFLGVFYDFYGPKAEMPIMRAVLISVLGFLMVLLILAVIALFIKLIAFIFSLFVKNESVTVNKTSSDIVKENNFLSAKTDSGFVKLIDVDETTAATLMAITAYKTGIPLENLNFRSIRRIDDNNDKE